MHPHPTPTRLPRWGPRPGCVAPRSNSPGILGRRALPSGRLARLGATPDFRHGLLTAEAAENAEKHFPCVLRCESTATTKTRRATKHTKGKKVLFVFLCVLRALWSRQRVRVERARSQKKKHLLRALGGLCGFCLKTRTPAARIATAARGRAAISFDRGRRHSRSAILTIRSRDGKAR